MLRQQIFGRIWQSVCNDAAAFAFATHAAALHHGVHHQRSRHALDTTLLVDTRSGNTHMRHMQGMRLRYVGVIDCAAGTAAVRLEHLPPGHPIAQLAGSDNCLACTTARYAETPLVVRGPGAGSEVTAGGVFSDLLRLCSALGAPL